MNPEARAAWSSYLAERVADRLDAPDWLDVLDAISAIVGDVDYDAELAKLTAESA